MRKIKSTHSMAGVVVAESIPLLTGFPFLTSFTFPRQGKNTKAIIKCWQ